MYIYICIFMYVYIYVYMYIYIYVYYIVQCFETKFHINEWWTIMRM